MKKITGTSIEDTLINASKQFSCSVCELEYEIIQEESSGFMGFFKKEAIIVARQSKVIQKEFENTETLDVKPQIKKERNTESNKNNQNIEKEENIRLNCIIDDSIDSVFFSDCSDEMESKPKVNNRNIEEVCKEVEKKLKELFALLPFDIDQIEVTSLEEDTLFITFNGKDSALLIGKEGYRYKSMSYLIFNYVNEVYGLNTRLEIAEFLSNQEDMIKNYLHKIIETVKNDGYAETKPLDGILLHIALKQLRIAIPNAYIGIRDNMQMEKYIIIKQNV